MRWYRLRNFLKKFLEGSSAERGWSTLGAMSTPKQIEVLVIRTTGEAEFHKVPRGFRSLKALIDDGWLEQVGGDGENWAAFGDEEGRLKGLPENAAAFTLMRTLTPYHPTFPVGPVVFVGLEFDPEDGFLEDDIPDRIKRIFAD